MQVTVIDAHQFFGAEINRENNRLNGVQLINSNSELSNYRPSEEVEVESYDLNRMQLLRIETDIKLNVVTWDD